MDLSPVLKIFAALSGDLAAVKSFERLFPCKNAVLQYLP
jgi:hypothetical protein